MLERFLFLLLLIHEAPAPPRSRRSEEVSMDPPLQAQPDLPDLSGMFGGFNMFQPTSENDQNEATVETVEDNVVPVDDSHSPGAMSEENSDSVIEEVETDTFSSEVNGGQEIDDQVLQNLNLMPSFDTIGNQVTNHENNIMQCTVLAFASTSYEYDISKMYLVIDYRTIKHSSFWITVLALRSLEIFWSPKNIFSEHDVMDTRLGNSSFPL